MKAGLARIDLTPAGPVWMDGMLRSHRSSGVHDPIGAKALVLSPGEQSSDACAIISLDVCAMSSPDCQAIRVMIEKQTGIPYDRIIVAATHNHSGPATFGFFCPREDAYTQDLASKIAAMVKKATETQVLAAVGCGAGAEDSISHYRRLLADDGHVVMNWEPWPGRIVRALGSIDPDLGVLKVVAADARAQSLGLLFNHAGHPNVMSGDNYQLSADYPGRTEALLEREYGGTALFVNGAQGTMDIDGLKDRDWVGIERVARALAGAVKKTAQAIIPRPRVRLRVGSHRYTVPARKISDKEKAWAEEIIKKTGGAVQPVADGVGDDYKAAHYLKCWQVQHQAIPLEQVCLAIDDYAFISFPGELFTEIGLWIKAVSPFRHTYILGLANGYVGYIPTPRAIAEGGYEPAVRQTDDSAAEIIVAQSLALLRSVHGGCRGVPTLPRT